MTFLPDSEIKGIKQYCKEKTPSGNSSEFLCAMRVIENALGEEWCIASVNNNFKESGGRLFAPEKDHPFSRLLGKNIWQSQDMTKIILFAHYLEDLSNLDNVKEKINRYVRSEKRSKITYHEFESIFFELKIASFYNRMGLGIEFLRESNIPSPDLKISLENDHFFLECKKKRYEAYSISSILSTIKTASNEQLEPRNDSGIIAVDLSLSDDVFKLKKEEILTKTQLLIKDLKLVNFIEIYNETSWKFDPERNVIGFHKNIIENPYPVRELSRKIVDVIFKPQVPFYKPFIS